MRRLSRRRMLGGLGGAGALMVMGGGGRSGSFAFAQGAVVLNIVTAKANAIRDISIPELRQLYRGRHIPVAGLKVIPFNHPIGTFDRSGFDRVLFGMTPDEVGRFWIDQRIRGGDSPPRTIDSVSLLLRVVAALEGAVGYVREGFSSADLKVVTIDGRMPGDARYPLVI
jgi:hypothetical protein